MRNPFVYLLIFWTSTFMSGAIVAQPQSVDAPTSGQCKLLKQQAHDELVRLRSPDERNRPRVKGLELIEKAIEICWSVAENTKDPQVAAEMAAETYLAKARRSAVLREPRERAREILSEGIETVKGLDHDRSPALIELLHESAYKEGDVNANRGQELMELSAELARESYGERDVRYADKLNALGFLYAPSELNPSKRGTKSKRALELYRTALGIYLKQDNPTSFPQLELLVNDLKVLLQLEGRSSEADEMGELLEDLAAEQQRAEEEHKAEDDLSRESSPDTRSDRSRAHDRKQLFVERHQGRSRTVG